MTPPLRGSRTHEHLLAAFAAEAKANRRYLYFAKRADIEGRPEVGALFREIAEGETLHAHGHLEFLAEVGDPATGMPITTTSETLASAIAGETEEATKTYPAWAKVAREEGFVEVADWFETLARAEKSHAVRFQKGLRALEQE